MAGGDTVKCIMFDDEIAILRVLLALYVSAGTAPHLFEFVCSSERINERTHHFRRAWDRLCAYWM